MNYKSFRDHTMLIWQPLSFLKGASVHFLPMQLTPSAWWELSTSAVLAIAPEFTVFHRLWNAALPMYHLTTISKVGLRKQFYSATLQTSRYWHLYPNVQRENMQTLWYKKQLDGRTHLWCHYSRELDPSVHNRV